MVKTSKLHCTYEYLLLSFPENSLPFGFLEAHLKSAHILSSCEALQQMNTENLLRVKTGETGIYTYWVNFNSQSK